MFFYYFISIIFSFIFSGVNSKSSNKIIGKLGEEQAQKFLKKMGWKILETNYRYSRFAEIDIIAKKNEFYIFVEVKTRKSADFARGLEHVDRRKQDRIRITASIYLSENPTKLQPRFDVIEIYAPDGPDTLRPEIYHMEDAFQ